MADPRPAPATRDLVAVPPSAIEPIWLTKRQAAEAIGVCERTLDELINGNQLPRVKVGKLVRIPVRGLREWCERVERTEAG